MGVEHETVTTYTCDQCGTQVVLESGEGLGAAAPSGWLNMGILWFHQWGCLRDYAAERSE